MKGREMAEKSIKKLLLILEKYKYVLLVLLAGVLLLLLPAFGASSKPTTEVSTHSETFHLEALERKLTATLSQVEGAGETNVILTLKAGPRSILAQDVSLTEKEGDTERSTSTIITSKGTAGQEAVLLQEVYPIFQGALVVCPGGDSPIVRLKLVEAVSALTGLGADKISICKSQ